jgi:hypothetical protein
MSSPFRVAAVGPVAFFEVATQAVGCWRGFILLLECCEGRGWSIFYGEPSKVLVFFEAIRGLSFFQ